MPRHAFACQADVEVLATTVRVKFIEGPAADTEKVFQPESLRKRKVDSIAGGSEDDPVAKKKKNAEELFGQPL